MIQVEANEKNHITEHLLVDRIHYFLYKYFETVVGLKALCLDEDTLYMISVLFGRHDLLKRDVSLIYKLPQLSALEQSTLLQSVKAVLLVRPTFDNILLIQNEIKAPRFGEYHLLFTAPLHEKFLKILAKSDVYNSIRSIQQTFIDIQLVTPRLYTLDISFSLSFTQQSPALWTLEEQMRLQRIVDGIMSCLILSNRTGFRATIYPTENRFFQYITNALHDTLNQPNVFKQLSIISDEEPSGTLLFLIPREEDYITPLLTPWTYQAMIHEYLGLERNRLVLHNENKKDSVTETLSSLNQTIVSCYTDSFFANHWMCDFGKTAENVQQMLEKYKARCTTLHETNFNTVKETIPSIYTTLQQEQIMLSRHVEILNAINKQIQERQLVDVSRYEQELVCYNKPEKNYEELCHFLDLASLCIKDKIRLAHLFYLHYPNNALSEKVHEKITDICQDDESYLESLKILRKMMLEGCYRSKNPTYGKEGLFQLACNAVKRGLNPTCNETFSQHRSFATDLVESVLKNKSIQGYNYTLSSFVSSPVSETKTSSLTLLPHILKDSKQQMIDICVFFIGGATYREATELYYLSKAYNCSITIGGTTLHNSQSFLNSICNFQSSSETTQMSTLGNTCFHKSLITPFQQPMSVTPLNETSTHKDLTFVNKKKFLHELW